MIRYREFLCDVLTWLPVPQRIQFKIAPQTFDCIRGTRPAYFSSIACTVDDNWSRPGLRSAERGDLFVPRTRITRLGRQSFFITAPVVWNSLLLHLRSPSISHRWFLLPIWAGLSLTFPLKTTTEEVELNWAALKIWQALCLVLQT